MADGFLRFMRPMLTRSVEGKEVQRAKVMRLRPKYGGRIIGSERAYWPLARRLPLPISHMELVHISLAENEVLAGLAVT